MAQHYVRDECPDVTQELGDNVKIENGTFVETNP
jgi:hypothetical protein